MNLLYIANIRLPTYRAHGTQILKMCEAFAALHNSVSLLVPNKRNTTGMQEDVFTQYGIQTRFSIRTLPALDLLGVTEKGARLFYWIDYVSFLCALCIYRLTHGTTDSVIYVRDPLLALPFSRKRHVIVVEVHEIPQRTRIFKKALARATEVFVLTHELKESVIALGIPSEHVHVAPDGVDIAHFSETESKHDARARLGIPQDAFVAGYIGRLDGWKGVETLLAASALIPDVHVAIIGGDTEEVVELKEKFPRVQFLGNRPYRELPDNQAAMDVLVIPNTARHITSRKYTSPLKLFTYMASGVPIVASDLPSLREVLDESCAVLVTPDSPAALAEGVRYVERNSTDSLERAQRAQALVTKYTWDARARGIVDLLTKTHEKDNA